MLEKVRTAVYEHNLFEEGDRVIAAVSGGPDSVVLLYILAELALELKFTLRAAHLDHMIRGAEAGADARFVEQLAEKMGIPVTVDRVDVPALQKKKKLSPEDAARRARYEFLFRLAEEVSASKIALGHHADDQAETVLLHLLRGAGPEGLAGMEYRSGRLCRPLLGVRRQEVLDFCKEKGLTYRTDSTNRDTIYLRNRVRLELIPLLAEYNPNVVEAVNRTADIIRLENAYLEARAHEAFSGAVHVLGDSRIKLNVPVFRELDTALQRRVLLRCFGILYGGEGYTEFFHVENLRQFVSTGSSGRNLDLPLGLVAEKIYDAVELKPAAGGEETGTAWEPVFLNVPGVTEVPALGASVNAEILHRKTLKDLNVPADTALLDMGKMKLPLYIRPWAPGDAFHPLGAPGKKKVKDFFIDAKVPRRERARLPVVLDMQHILWVAGMRIDDRVKITPVTEKVLRLQLATK